MCPSQMPSGSAITIDTPIAAALSSRCSTILVSIRWALSPMNVKAWPKSLIGSF